MRHAALPFEAPPHGSRYQACERYGAGSASRIAALLTGVVLVGAVAPGTRAEDGEIPFDVANVFFELNDTDGDLGIHALIDGEPWKSLRIEAPNGRKLLGIWLKSQLRRQGLTELFFESAEPTFDELDPEEFFERFPEGEYEIEGKTLAREELESTAIVTHLLPAPPENIAINAMALPEDCDEGPVPEVSEPFEVSWEAVMLSHPELGRTNEPIEVVRYQVVVEREEDEDDPSILPLKVTIDLPSSVTQVRLPEGLTSSSDQLKIEVLVREDSGNQTAVESCFEVE